MRTLISQGVCLNIQIIMKKRAHIKQNRQTLAKVMLESYICNFYSELKGNYKLCLCFWIK